MNRNFEDRKPINSRIHSKENKAIIKALDVYGRVPEQWELLEEIERLNNIINEFDKWLDEESEKTILSTGQLTCLIMCKNKLQELKGEVKNGYN